MGKQKRATLNNLLPIFQQITMDNSLSWENYLINFQQLILNK